MPVDRKLRNYVYRYGTELSDDKLKKMGTSLEEINENFSDMEDTRRVSSSKSVLLLKRYSKNTISTDGTQLTFYYWLETDPPTLFNVSPSVSYKLAEAFPELFEQHKLERSNFIYEKD